MRHYAQSAVVDVPQEVAFGVVAELGAYPEFIDSCDSVCVTNEADDELAAVLSMRGAGLSGEVPVSLELSQPAEIRMHLESEFFSCLEAQWRFDVVDEERTEIHLSVDYDFPGRVQAMMLGKAAEHALKRLIDGVAAEAARRQP